MRFGRPTTNVIKEWDETYWQAGRVKTTSATVSLMGVTAQIGRIRPDGQYEFFVKSSNGSTMLTVDDRGRYNTGTQRAYDYLALGINKLLKVGSDTTDVKQKYEGKELELLTGLYSFGARWQDPELGMWMSPDPAEQFFNPYSYNGGDPINGIDPDGRETAPDGTRICGTGVQGPNGGDCELPDRGDNTTQPPPDPSIEGTLAALATGAGAVLLTMASSIPEIFAGGAGSIFSSGQQTGGGESVASPNATDASHGLDPSVLKGLSPEARKEYIDRYMNQGDKIGGEKSVGSIPGGGDGPKSNVYTPAENAMAQRAFERFQSRYEKQTASLAYWNKEGHHDLEAGFYDRHGRIVGPYMGETNRNMGQPFMNLKRDGDVLVHIHPYTTFAAGLPNVTGLSGFDPTTGGEGDLGAAESKNMEIYDYEVSTGEVFYSNPALVEKYGIDRGSLASMPIGIWDYHSTKNIAPKFHAY